MKRVEAASGAKYSTHKEQARKFEPIAPVGTSYTPVGKVDIEALRKGPAARTGAIAPKPAMPSAPRPGFAAPSGPQTSGRAGSSAWDDAPSRAPAAAAPPPPPAASRPPVITAARPTPAVSISVVFFVRLHILTIYAARCTRSTCRPCPCCVF